MTRVNTEKWIGSQYSDDPDDPLLPATRAQMNFAENVPLALVLASVVELNGGSRRFLTGALSALFVLRILHAEAGIMAKNSLGPGRPAGHFGTQAVVTSLAGYAAWLVKRYWGF